MVNQFTSAISIQSDLDQAVDEIGEQVCDKLDGINAAVVFATHRADADWSRFVSRLVDRLGTDRLIGCLAEGVAGQGCEIEEGPAVSVWAANLSSLRLHPFGLQFERTPEGAAIVGWPDQLLHAWPDAATMIILADPFTFPADYLLQQINEDRPGTVVLGGMASGGSQPGEHRLFAGSQQFETGAVGWMVEGDLPILSVVSQGCRPIGPTFVVTSAEQNRIQQLGGKPALEQLQHVFAQLPTHEQQLCQRGLHLGRVVSEYQDRFEMGDFLIRNVLGIDQETKAVAVGDYIRPGQTVQFHLRDERTASLELEQLLQRHAQQYETGAALLFTCNGRGTRLFSEPHHDAAKVAQELGNIPLAGFFAQGEIGPVGGKNFLHGFTASLALFSASPDP